MDDREKSKNRYKGITPHNIVSCNQHKLKHRLIAGDFKT